MRDTQPISRRHARRGVRWFVTCSALGIVGVLGYTSFSESLVSLSRLRPSYVVVAILLNLLDWLLGSARIYAISGALYPPLKFISCFKADVSNIFLGGVTPSQTGGGPAQIYVLYKDGMSFANATVSSLMCFLATMVFLIGCAVYLTMFPPSLPLNPSLIFLSRTTIILFVTIIIIFFSSVLRPAIFERLFRALLCRLPRIQHWMERKGWREVFVRSIYEYHDIMTFYVTRARLRLLAGMAFTVLIYLNKFFIAYVVIRGLGASSSPGEVVYTQMILFLIFYFAPSPGASGVAEFVSGMLMGHLLPPHSQAVFTILWRSFTLYFGMIVGGIVFFRYLTRDE